MLGPHEWHRLNSLFGVAFRCSACKRVVRRYHEDNDTDNETLEYVSEELERLDNEGCEGAPDL